MRRVAALACVLILAAAAVSAQFGRRGFRFDMEPVTEKSFDGGFTFCRIQYDEAANGDGGGWNVDWPRADQNLPTRLAELTRTPISRDERGDPKHVLLRLTDPHLFRCPFIMMTEVGNIFLQDDEAAALRDYLLKGGFLWADDFWGEWAWQVWESQIRKALPSGGYPVIDLPPDHMIYRAVINVDRVPQIPSINFWGGPGGPTSERGSDSATPHLRAILDERGRMLVLITHNTDIGDSFEHEGTDPNYFRTFSVDGYALGINVLVYSMTH